MYARLVSVVPLLSHSTLFPLPSTIGDTFESLLNDVNMA